MFSWFEQHSKVSWVVTILIAIFIFYISSLTFAPGTGTTNLLSIIYHILIFFFFSLFLFISSVKRNQKARRLFLLTVVISIIYAVLDELHQHFVPGRSSSISDIFLDSLGISFSSVIYFILMVYSKITGKIHK